MASIQASIIDDLVMINMNVPSLEDFNVSQCVEQRDFHQNGFGNVNFIFSQ
jgi:hypothetical protein